MTLKKWIVFFVSLLAITFMLICVNALFAGILYTITWMFEPEEAFIVLKWVTCGLLILEVPIVIPPLYDTIKYDQGGNDSGT